MFCLVLVVSDVYLDKFGGVCCFLDGVGGVCNILDVVGSACLGLC